MSSTGAYPPPPYPMKLAPADLQQTEDPDSQFIRAETCVFLVKLPRFNSSFYCEAPVSFGSFFNESYKVINFVKHTKFLI